jgi:hypothetical protein
MAGRQGRNEAESRYHSIDCIIWLGVAGLRWGVLSIAITPRCVQSRAAHLEYDDLRAGRKNRHGQMKKGPPSP